MPSALNIAGGIGLGVSTGLQNVFEIRNQRIKNHIAQQELKQAEEQRIADQELARLDAQGAQGLTNIFGATATATPGINPVAGQPSNPFANLPSSSSSDASTAGPFAAPPVRRSDSQQVPIEEFDLNREVLKTAAFDQFERQKIQLAFRAGRPREAELRAKQYETDREEMLNRQFGPIREAAKAIKKRFFEGDDDGARELAQILNQRNPKALGGIDPNSKSLEALVDSVLINLGETDESVRKADIEVAKQRIIGDNAVDDTQAVDSSREQIAIRGTTRDRESVRLETDQKIRLDNVQTGNDRSLDRQKAANATDLQELKGEQAEADRDGKSDNRPDFIQNTEYLRNELGVDVETAKELALSMSSKGGKSGESSGERRQKFLQEAHLQLIKDNVNDEEIEDRLLKAAQLFDAVNGRPAEPPKAGENATEEIDLNTVDLTGSDKAIAPDGKEYISWDGITWYSTTTGKKK